MDQRITAHTASRREFLATAATASLAGAALMQLQANAAEPSRPKRPWKKAVMWYMVGGKGTVMEKFKILKEAGFDGVELDAPNGPKPAEVKEAMDATGIIVEGVVDSVHWNITLSDPDPKKRAAGVEALKMALRMCKEYGGTSCLLVPAVVNKQVSYDDAYRRSQEEVAKAIPVAAETGVKIAIENVWNQFLLSPLEAARYVDEFNSPHIGWHFDIGNVINYGWPEQWIRILGKRILKLHIKEFSRKKRDSEGLWKGFDVELTEGDNDWPAIVKALDEIGYTGWGSAEVAGGDLNRLKFVSERMDKIWAM
jgi:L-ribulose-5-phosphate 3-epimerase